MQLLEVGLERESAAFDRLGVQCFFLKIDLFELVGGDIQFLSGLSDAVGSEFFDGNLGDVWSSHGASGLNS